MSDKNLNEWLFANIDDLIDCDYSDESKAEIRMIDNEIFETEIKCINRRANGKCNGGTDCCKCDLLMNEKDIISAYERAIANSNLINRLQAKIDELKHEREVLIEDIHHYTDKINEQLKEIERLKKVNDSFTDIGKLYSEIKSEAYKEFAEYLKEKWSNNDYYSPDVDFDEFVDNLLKEMVVRSDG